MNIETKTAKGVSSYKLDEILSSLGGIHDKVCQNRAILRDTLTRLYGPLPVEGSPTEDIQPEYTLEKINYMLEEIRSVLHENTQLIDNLAAL